MVRPYKPVLISCEWGLSRMQEIFLATADEPGDVTLHANCGVSSQSNYVFQGNQFFIVSADRDTQNRLLLASSQTLDAICPDFQTNALRIAALPFALALDAATSPYQLLAGVYLGAMIIGNYHPH
jgi:hypothetical protein